MEELEFSEEAMKHVASLPAIFSQKNAYTAETFARVYGKHSILYYYAIKSLRKLLEEKKDLIIHLIFKEWKSIFESVYPRKKVDEDLFLNHVYLGILIYLSLHKVYFPNQTLNSLSMTEMKVWFEKRGCIIFPNDFISWGFEDLEMLKTLYHGLKSAEHDNGKKPFKTGDLFHIIYQQIISPTTRHSLGEYYTPPELARLMVEESYQFGKKVLDPACGSGTFLIEVVRSIKSNVNKSLSEKLNAMRNIFGFDVNPIAIATTKANILLNLRDLSDQDEDFTKNVLLCDFLFHPELKNSDIVQGDFDLVIANPPWLVINGIHGFKYGEKLKKLAKEYGISPCSHQVSNFEVSSLFLYTAKKYLKNNGMVFFVVSNGFITGDNHLGTRQFVEFDDIVIWKFKTDLFNIHNICLSAHYRKDLTRTLSDLKSLRVKAIVHEPIILLNKTIMFPAVKNEVLRPYDVQTTSQPGIFRVKKLITLTEMDKLLPLGVNAYQECFFNGASLKPRNMVFVKTEDNSDTTVKITPLVRNAKKPWDFNVLDELGKDHEIIEKKFVFDSIKSEFIVPFLNLISLNIFLPLESNGEDGGFRVISNTKSKAWQYFEKLMNLYKKYKKKNARIQDFWSYVNYQGKTTAKRQKAPIKVVMAMIGSLTKACVIQNTRAIVDFSNYFMAVDSLDEAYYILGFLNSPVLTQSIQIIQAEGARGGGRNIGKRPFEFRFPKFNPSSELHRKIAYQAKIMEIKAKAVAKAWIEKEKIKILKKNQKCGKGEEIIVEEESLIKPRTIQNRIYIALGWNTKSHILSGDYLILDNLLRRLLVPL